MGDTGGHTNFGPDVDSVMTGLLIGLVVLAIVLGTLWDIRDSKKKGIHPLVGWMVQDKRRVERTEPPEEDWPFS
jgi:hypothetical protein